MPVWAIGYWQTPDSLRCQCENFVCTYNLIEFLSGLSINHYMQLLLTQAIETFQARQEYTWLSILLVDLPIIANRVLLCFNNNIYMFIWQCQSGKGWTRTSIRFRLRNVTAIVTYSVDTASLSSLSRRRFFILNGETVRHKTPPIIYP